MTPNREFPFLVCGGALVVGIAMVSTTWSADGTASTAKAPSGRTPATTEKIVKTDAEWRAVLSAEQYHVTRQKGTERAFTGAYWETKTDGIYECGCCGRPLFDSKAKFESHTGWPSFFKPIDNKAVTEHEDNSLFMARTEVVCSHCDAHLGHVFSDGPPPTGQRYCMNSAALKLVKRSSVQRPSGRR